MFSPCQFKVYVSIGTLDSDLLSQSTLHNRLLPNFKKNFSTDFVFCYTFMYTIQLNQLSILNLSCLAG